MAAALGLSAEGALAEPFYMGSDISLLPFIESRGGTFRDGGQVRPAEQILVNHGHNLFRLRLFVNPDPNYDNASNRGAIQDQAYTIALAQRLKQTGAKILLDLHYSDTWADPGSQSKPAAWASQNWTTLQSTVRTYTRDTLIAFRDAGVMPEMVQVGNEITNGMLYGTTVVPPTGGQVVYTGTQQNQSWMNFGTLLNAAVAGVHDVDALTPGRHTDVAIHIDGGDVPGRAQYYFNQLTSVAGVPTSSYDIMGMSFYGTTSTALSNLEDNLEHLATSYDKQVMVLEVNKRWKGTSSGPWPSTPNGQRDFLIAVRDLVRNLPNDRGRGVVWWYPESIQIPGTFIWQSGAIALFDDDTDGSGSDGHDALPALSAFALAPSTWSPDADGTWYNAMNWSGGVPMFAGNAANFSSAITTPRTVTVNGPRAVGIINFDSAHAYTLTGDALTLDAASGNAAISVVAGHHTVATPVVLNDDLAISVAGGASVELTEPLPAAGRTIHKTGDGMARVRSIHVAGLNVTGGTFQVTLNGSASAVSRIGALSVSAGATVDLADNAMITSTPVGTWDGSAYTGISGLIQSGRLLSTEADAQDGLTALGVATAAQAGRTTFAGVSVSPQDVLVMYTYTGDANLDGKINIDDYGRIDANISVGGASGWFSGDFNYDGKINIDDYGIIDGNISRQGEPFFESAVRTAAVPEPFALPLLATAAALLACRRRYRRAARNAFSAGRGVPVSSNSASAPPRQMCRPLSGIASGYHQT